MPNLLALTLPQFITPTTTEPDNQALSSVPSMAEIKKATFYIHPDMAPRPDGYNALFFQRFWHLVGLDVEKMVQAFFSDGYLDT